MSTSRLGERSPESGDGAHSEFRLALYLIWGNTSHKALTDDIVSYKAKYKSNLLSVVVSYYHDAACVWWLVAGMLPGELKWSII